MSPTTFLETLNALSLATDERGGHRQAGRGGEVSRNRPDIRLQFPVSEILAGYVAGYFF